MHDYLVAQHHPQDNQMLSPIRLAAAHLWWPSARIGKRDGSSILPTNDLATSRVIVHNVTVRWPHSIAQGELLKLSATR